MLDFDTAQSKLASAGTPISKIESVNLANASGRIIAQTITATLDLPPADNSAMDGYALRAHDFQLGKPLPIQEHVFAGDSASALEPGKAIRLFTGSIIPEGADTVVMQEHATEKNNQVVFDPAPEKGRHIRYKGEDVRKGSNIILAGTKIGAGEIALLASQGIASVEVYKPLKAGVLTNGDELVNPGQSRAPEQIYNSNAPMLTSMLSNMGVQVTHTVHASDTPESIKEAFNTLLNDCDLIITVGGVSVGDKDLVKPTIESLGGSLDMWRVSMKPGKPVAMAHINNKPVVCLPGNPVSSFVVLTVLVSPLIRKIQGRTCTTPTISYGKLNTQRTLGGGRDDFVRVKATYDNNGNLTLHPHSDQGSAIISSLSWADGVARLPAGGKYSNGDTVAFYDFKHWLS